MQRNLLLQGKHHTLVATLHLLRGIEYNSSNKGKYSNTNKIGTTESTENCETEKKNTEVENDKRYLSTM